MKRKISVVCLLLMVVLCSSAQQLLPFVVMEWNVENLFDTQDDTLKLDEDFTPGGSYHWTRYRYWKKLTDIARVIAVAGEGSVPPALVGLCEVENDSVMTDLTTRGALREMGYRYMMTDSPDERGIDVVLMYQPARFRPVYHHAFRVPSIARGYKPTRDILYVKGLTRSEEGVTGFDTLHVFVVHFPSKTGGRKGDRNRALAAELLQTVTDSILQRDAAAKLLVMGDCNSTTPPCKTTLHACRPPKDARPKGTYCYRGVWQQIDHILLSSSLQKKAGKVQIISLPYLLEENKTYGGSMPFRTFRGPTYHGGVSDHLPLVVTL